VKGGKGGMIYSREAENGREAGMIMRVRGGKGGMIRERWMERK
jgi:hypothetical protein